MGWEVGKNGRASAQHEERLGVKNELQMFIMLEYG